MFFCFVVSDAIGRIRVLSVKTALSTLCAGRLVDKLRCKYRLWLSQLIQGVSVLKNREIFNILYWGYMYVYIWLSARNTVLHRAVIKF